MPADYPLSENSPVDVVRRTDTKDQGGARTTPIEVIEPDPVYRNEIVLMRGWIDPRIVFGHELDLQPLIPKKTIIKLELMPTNRSDIRHPFSNIWAFKYCVNAVIGKKEFTP